MRILNKVDAERRNLLERLEKSLDPIIVLSPFGILETANRAVEKALQYRNDEMVGKHFFKLGVLETASLVVIMKAFALILLGKQQPPFELAFIRKDGTKIYYEGSAQLIGGSPTRGVQVILSKTAYR